MITYLQKQYLFSSTLLCLGFVLASHSAIAQGLPDESRVTVEFVDIPIDSALILLSAQSGVGISFDPRIIPQENQVSLAANRLMLGLALDNVFVNTDLEYKIVGNQIVVKEEAAPIPVVKYVNISGYFEDVESGERLVYANVADPLGLHGNASNEFGYYSLSLPVGSYELQYSYVGYEEMIIPVNLSRDTVIDVHLQPSTYLNEVVILGEVPKVSKYTEDFTQMPIEVLNGMASLAGEPDIIRMAQSRSGVSSQVDGFGGLQVRGGTADQNLILLDGVPVYNTGHALGLFSIFNSSAIKSAKLIKGGFPARYGGRLSSVLDVRTKEGNKKEIHGDASISPLMIKGTIEGPIVEGKGSFLFSARRTIVDPWLKPLSRYQFERNNEDGQINFFFYDINAKVNFEIGSKNQVFLSLYTGKDKYANTVTGSLDTNQGIIEELDETDVSWGNNIGTLRWTSNFSKKLFGHASFSLTGFQFDNFDFTRTITRRNNIEVAKGYTSRLFSSDIEDAILAYDLDWYASPNLYIKGGFNLTTHQLIPGSDLSSTIDDNLNSQDLITIEDIKSQGAFDDFEGKELRLYIENEVRFGRQFSANIGAHFSSINVDNNTYRNLQPRLSAQWKFNDKYRVKFGYSVMDQYFHLLSSAGFGLPSDVWLPSTDIIPPERSRQFSISAEGEVYKDIVLRVAAFDKRFSNVTGFAQGASLDISGNTDWQVDVPIGNGTARGVELEIEKRVGRVKGWISYTLSESYRSFEDINDGRPFRASNDRKHLLNIMTLTRINDNMELSLGWTYGSSLPATVPASTDPIVIDGQFIWVPIVPAINNVELPPYHKLDLGFNLYNKYDWGSQKISFGVYNAYARKNPYYIDVVFDESGGNYNNEQISILPFIPYVSLGVSF